MNMDERYKLLLSCAIGTAAFFGFGIVAAVTDPGLADRLPLLLISGAWLLLIFAAQPVNVWLDRRAGRGR